MGEQNRAIYILLSDSGTFFSKTVKYYTKIPYSHVSISFDTTLTHLYSFGRKKPWNPLHGGFIEESIYSGNYAYFPQTKGLLFKLMVTKRQEVKIKRLVKMFLSKKEAYNYHFMGIIGIVVNYPFTMKSAYFCSQFVSELLRRSGIVLWDKPSALVTAKDFLDHPLLIKIYEGKLTDYQCADLAPFFPNKY